MQKQSWGSKEFCDFPL